MIAPKTNVYIDGFNFYYGCYKNSLHPGDKAFKWLDLSAFCIAALPGHQIHRIKYFTAKVSGSPHDPQQPLRQELFLRALRTCQNPKVNVYFGHFLTTRKTGKLLTSAGLSNHLTTIQIFEEKGSDVNLATELLVDGYEADYDVSVVISNDSDLAGPIRVVRQRLKRDVHVLNPHSNVSTVMKKVASNYGEIPREHLANCQFSPILRDRSGQFRKPLSW